MLPLLQAMTIDRFRSAPVKAIAAGISGAPAIMVIYRGAAGRRFRLCRPALRCRVHALRERGLRMGRSGAACAMAWAPSRTRGPVEPGDAVDCRAVHGARLRSSLSRCAADDQLQRRSAAGARSVGTEGI